MCPSIYLVKGCYSRMLSLWCYPCECWNPLYKSKTETFTDQLFRTWTLGNPKIGRKAPPAVPKKPSTSVGSDLPHHYVIDTYMMSWCSNKHKTQKQTQRTHTEIHTEIKSHKKEILNEWIPWCPKPKAVRSTEAPSTPVHPGPRNVHDRSPQRDGRDHVFQDLDPIEGFDVGELVMKCFSGDPVGVGSLIKSTDWIRWIHCEVLPAY